MLNNVEKCRAAIDLKQSSTDSVILKQQLASYYSLSPTHEGFKFSIDELKTYLDDWYSRDITIAFEFIKLAIDNHYEKFEQIFKYHKATAGEKSHLIYNYIKESMQKKRKEQYASHYLNLTEDPDKFIFDIKKLPQYINDWIQGITTAEGFVIKSLKEDPHGFISLVDQYPVGQSTKLFALALKNLDSNRDSKLFLIIHYKQEIAKTNDLEKMILILKEIRQQGIISQVLTDNIGLISQILALFNTSMEKYSNLKDNNFIVDFYVQMLESNEVKPAFNLFLAALSGNHHVVISCLKKKLADEVNVHKKLPTNSCLKIQEISLEYFLHSILQNEEALFATIKNEEQFTELFCQELDWLKNNSCDQTLKIRQEFYQKLITHQAMKNFSNYESCVIKMSSVFNAAKLSLPILKDAVITQDGKNGYLLNFSLEERAKQYQNICKQLLPAQFQKEFEKSKIIRENSGNSPYFRFRLLGTQYELITEQINLTPVSAKTIPVLRASVKNLIRQGDIKPLSTIFSNHPALTSMLPNSEILQLLLSCIIYLSPNEINLLLQTLDLKINGLIGNENTLLTAAVESGNSETVKKILTVPAIDINQERANGEAPLQIAAKKKFPDIIKILLASSDINLLISHNENLAIKLVPYSIIMDHFKEAIKKDDRATAQILMDNFDDLLKDIKNEYAIYSAIQSNALSVLKIIIDKIIKSDPYIQISELVHNGYSPLHIASSAKNLAIVKFLVETYQLNINTIVNDKNNPDNGATPLYLACKHSAFQIVHYFLQNGADFTILTANGQSIWHLAAEKNDLATIKLLLLESDRQNNRSRHLMEDAVTIARQKGCLEILQEITLALLLDTIKSQEEKKNSQFLETAIILHGVATGHVAKECLDDETTSKEISEHIELKNHFDNLCLVTKLQPLLPGEILANRVAGFLNYKTLLSLSRTSKYFAQNLQLKEIIVKKFTPKLISAGFDNSFLLFPNNKLVVFGENDRGQLGLGHTRSPQKPQRVTLPEDKILKQISAGAKHTLILFEDGTVYSFGNNQHGQLGKWSFSAHQVLPEHIKLSVDIFDEENQNQCNMM